MHQPLIRPCKSLPLQYPKYSVCSHTCRFPHKPSSLSPHTSVHDAPMLGIEHQFPYSSQEELILQVFVPESLFLPTNSHASPCDHPLLSLCGWRDTRVGAPPLFVGFLGNGWNKNFQKPPWEDERWYKILLAWRYIPQFPMSHFPQASPEKGATGSSAERETGLGARVSDPCCNCVWFNIEARLKSIGSCVEPKIL